MGVPPKRKKKFGRRTDAADRARKRREDLKLANATAMPQQENEPIPDETPSPSPAKIRKAASRAAMSQEKKEEEAARSRKINQQWRDNMNADKREEMLKEDRERKRERKKLPPSTFAGRQVGEIQRGEKIVEAFYIGRLCDPLTGEYDETKIKKCEHCSALRWKGEVPSFCCSIGKVSLDPLWPNDSKTDTLKELFVGQGPIATTFRKHIVPINNALTLASLKVNRVDPPGSSFRPSVVIQGAVGYKMGPMRSTTDVPAAFAQLYVLNPALASQELELRMGNLWIPKSTGASERNILKKLLGELQEDLKDINPYIRDMRYMMATDLIDEDDPEPVQIIIDASKRPAGAHERIYTSGNVDQRLLLSEMSVLMHDEAPANQDFVVKRWGPGNHTECIPDTNRAADPLRFILFFPTGIDGWRLSLPPHREHQVGRCSGRQFYGYHLQVRHPPDEEGHFNVLLRGARLFQEYACLAMAKIQNQELKWHSMNQKKVRAEMYKKAMDEFHVQDADPNLIGKMTILNSSYQLSPRWYHKKFQDAVAIMRVLHKPDFFITITANPKWRAIQESLFPGQSSMDRPDLIARVFNQVLKEIHKDFKEGKIFGDVAGFMRVIEFQKRGLPHEHFLLILDDKDRIKNADEVDQIICAELPPDPMGFPEGPKRDQAQRLLDLVLNHMTHSCGPMCMENGKCKKYYPKNYCEETKWDEGAMYPEYRRREGRSEKHEGRLITNQNVVPYNTYLLLKYESHINIECCVSVLSLKYLYLYLYKGGDRQMITTSNNLNEVRHFENCRSIGSSEALWRIHKLPVTEQYPCVENLRVHCEEEQSIIIDNNIKEILNSGPPKTELTEFFAYNAAHPETRVRYVDFPEHYRWNKTEKAWTPRVRTVRVIGRVNTVHVTAGETYYLRILLHQNHCCGKTSFEDLRSIDGIAYDTYKETCGALGLLQDDGEWEIALSDAAHVKHCGAIRLLFDVILQYGEPENPRALFEKHIHEWTDDFKLKIPSATEAQLQVMVLLDLENRMQQRGSELATYRLPSPSAQDRQEIAKLTEQEELTRESVAMQEESNFDLEETFLIHETHKSLLNEDQKKIYGDVMNIVENHLDDNGNLSDIESCCMFIDARGGTGKTFLLNTILAGVRSMGYQPGEAKQQKHVAIAVAFSGIAATLLSLGRTFHSRFKVPLNIVDDKVTFGLKPNTVDAKVVGKAKIIVWDEGPMANRIMMEGLDNCLRDITRVNKPFGGKVLIVAGDFRQILPVVKHGSRAQIVNSILSRSPLFRHFKIRKLSKNLRVVDDPAFKEYDDFLLDLGNGLLPVEEEPDWCAVPERHQFHIDETNQDTSLMSLHQFIDLIFENLSDRAQGDETEYIEWVSGRAILAAKNVDVDKINNNVIEYFPGSCTHCYSADSCLDNGQAINYPVELLNSQTPNSVPPHCLSLKVGVLLILLRNLNPREGLCNGTRLILVNIWNRILQCKIASGKHAGKLVLIPRLDLKIDPNATGVPMEWKRRQFPVRLAFAMTINKSQGQTLKRAGVWLGDSCFTHGQLYVASSRVGDPDQLFYAVRTTDNGLMKNVVFHEALLEDPFITKPRVKAAKRHNSIRKISFSDHTLQQEPERIVQLPLLDPSSEDRPITTEIMASINTCTKSLENTAEDWNIEVSELKKQMKGIKEYVHHRPYSCAVDSILDLLSYTFATKVHRDIALICPSDGKDVNCECNFCGNQTEFFKRMMEYTRFRGFVRRREALPRLNNDIWDLLLQLLPTNFAPKGSGLAGNQDVASLFVSDSMVANRLWGVHRTSTECTCGSVRHDVQLPLELFGQPGTETFDDLLTFSVLLNSAQCSTCNSEVAVESFTFAKQLMFNLNLDPNLQNKKEMLPDAINLQGKEYKLDGLIKNMGSDEGTGVNHFVAVAKINGKIYELDDLKQEPEEFPNFYTALDALRGGGNLLQRVGTVVYSSD